MTYYKLVRERNNQLISVCMNGMFPDVFLVKYRENEWIEPTIKGTKLFVFNDLDSAITLFVELNEDYRGCYTGNRNNIKIYECDVEGEVQLRPAGVYDIEDYWNCVLNNKPTDNISFLNISDCYGCDRVKLTKLLDLEEIGV